MATFRKRAGKWQVQVRRNGHPPINRTFSKRTDGETWARQTEVQIERGTLPTDNKQLRTTTFATILTRYRNTLTAKKRGGDIERLRIDKFLDHPLSRYALAQITPAVVARYRDGRLCFVSAETVRRELTILRHVFEVARKDWGLRIPINPVSEITKPAPAKPRERRLQADELDRLIAGAGKGRCKLLSPILQLAVETGMRRSEMLALRWTDIDLAGGTLRIATSKNGLPRVIPLSQRAIELIGALPRQGDAVAPISPNALRLAWERLTKRVGISDLHFHDLRHEAISRLFEKGLSVPEVALISGHRDVRMLFRYTHLRAEDIVAKLG